MVPVSNRCAVVRGGEWPRVLLVEDDRRSHQLLLQILVQAGCEVVSAMTQAGGLDGLDDDLDCVLLDLHLPDGDGEAILRKIRSERRGLRVAVMTAERDPKRLRKLAELEPDLFLSKPIDLPQLIRWLDLPNPGLWNAPRLAVALN